MSTLTILGWILLAISLVLMFGLITYDTSFSAALALFGTTGLVIFLIFVGAHLATL